MARTWNEHLSGLAYGGDYNPEQWPREVWDDDIALMQQAGVNLVSLGIFSWASIEPLEGQFDWEWLDDIIERLHVAGIQIALATATASPPPWLTSTHPEILPRTAEGVVLHQGGRQAYSTSSEVYRNYAAGMTERMAQRYGAHPAVVLWHVDNEIGCHIPHDHSDAAAEGFRGWLQERYGSIEALNHAWGTAFWSQRYGSFDHVLPPLAAPTFPNPTQQLDFHRYSSDAAKGYLRGLLKVLREITPEIPVTTNFMCNTGNKAIDYHDWADEVDVVANDHYTRSHDDERHVELAFSADLTRGVAQGAPWLLMEHSTSAVNWQPRNRAKEPGEMLRNSLCHVARGADGAMFFQWRQSRAGAEKFHSAMVPHAGTDSQVWRNTVELGRALQSLAPVRDSRVSTTVALVFDYLNWWAVELDSHPHNGLRYPDLVLDWYRAFFHEGVQLDVVSPLDDLSGYHLVVAPNLYLADTARADALAAVAQRGGVVATTWFSGIVDENDQVILGGYPGAFTDLLGVRVEEFHPLQDNETVGVDVDGQPIEASTWSERVELRGAQSHGVFTSGPLTGLPAVTEHRVDSSTGATGRAWYVATDLPIAAKRALVRSWLDQTGLAPVLPDAPPEVEAVRRVGADGEEFVFLFNHGTTDVAVPVTGTDLLTGNVIDGELLLRSGASAVVQSDGQTNED